MANLPGEKSAIYDINIHFQHDSINNLGLIMPITLPIINYCYEVLASNRYSIFQFIGENLNQSIVCIEKLRD